jgi:hypothetical protein
MKNDSDRDWVDVPLDRIAVLLDPEKKPVQLRFTFSDGTHELVPAAGNSEQAPDLEKVLCSKISPAETEPPHWWG